MKDDPRRVALRALRRIDEGAYANLVVPGLLAASSLEQRDRDFVTELVYGTTRMRRACDWLLEPHLRREVEPDVRSALRLGAYQLHFLKTAPHAAVSATVEVAPGRAKGFVNAVLRRVAGTTNPAWPNVATELSYPDWIVNRLALDLGPDVARANLTTMNAPPEVQHRADGYVQDRASQLVAEAVEASTDEMVLDVCAAPGGKATGMGAGVVIALDVSPARAGLVVANAARLSHPEVHVAVGDGRAIPLRDGIADRVLVDAPCSGLGVLARRADARWRIEHDDVDRLAQLQRELLRAAMRTVRPGGRVVYSVCTLTTAETISIDEWLAAEYPAWTTVPVADPWDAVGRGGRLLPATHGTDGMYVLRLLAP